MKKILILFSLLLITLFSGCKDDSDINLHGDLGEKPINTNQNMPAEFKNDFSIKVILSPELEYGHYVITDLDELNSFKEESNLLLDEYTSKFFAANTLVLYLPEVNNYILIDSLNYEDGMINLKLIETDIALNNLRIMIAIELEGKKAEVSDLKSEYLEEVEETALSAVLHQFDSQADFEYCDDFVEKVLVINNPDEVKTLNNDYPLSLDQNKYNEDFFASKSLILIQSDKSMHYNYYLNKSASWDNNYYFNFKSISYYGANVFTQYIFVIEVSTKVNNDANIFVSYLK